MTKGEATQPFCFPITGALGHQHLRNINLVLFLSVTRKMSEQMFQNVYKNKQSHNGGLPSWPHEASISLECSMMAAVQTLETHWAHVLCCVCNSLSGGEIGVAVP